MLMKFKFVQYSRRSYDKTRGGVVMEKVRIGIAGLGTATRLMLQALMRHPNVEIVAVASVREEERHAFARDFAVPTYNDLRELCNLEEVDAIYVSTPTHLHVEHVLLALQHGKHVLVEKPLATDLQSAKQLVEASQRYHRLVIVGHSHSFDSPIQSMREIIASGRLGRMMMTHTWCYSDWLYRPRLPDELKTELGGGVTFRQGAHQFDVIRYLGGGLLRSVRAATGRWDLNRATEGNHSVFLEFENGAAATAVYSGYDRFQSSELTFGVGEWGHQAPGQSSYGVYRKRIQGLDKEEELRVKVKQSGYQSLGHLPVMGASQPFFGLTVVSCERGDIRQTPNGLQIYTDEGIEELTLSQEVTPHDNVIKEFCDALAGLCAPVHTAAWGLATLEVCLAVLESAENREEVHLRHQVSC